MSATPTRTCSNLVEVADLLPARRDEAGWVSVMHRGDEDLHYSDNSHRWIAPPEVEQAIWEAGLRAHMQQHRTTMGGPFDIDEVLEVPRPPIPRQRKPT
jgi:hypothetical protein